MISIFFIVLGLVLLFAAPPFVRTSVSQQQSLFRALREVVRATGVILIVLAVALTSFVFVGVDETGHRHKIYFGGNLKDGAIIATDGEKGPQAAILPPGFPGSVSIACSLRNSAISNTANTLALFALAMPTVSAMWSKCAWVSAIALQRTSDAFMVATGLSVRNGSMATMSFPSSSRKPAWPKKVIVMGKRSLLWKVLGYRF